MPSTRGVGTEKLPNGSFFIAGSLWHKDGWLPSAERIHYRRSYNRAGSLWHKITGVATPRNSPQHQV